MGLIDNRRQPPPARGKPACVRPVLDHLNDLATLGSLIFLCSVGVANPTISQQLGYLAQRIQAHATAAREEIGAPD